MCQKTFQKKSLLVSLDGKKRGYMTDSGRSMAVLVLSVYTDAKENKKKKNDSFKKKSLLFISNKIDFNSTSSLFY
jgi:hypothetical protein